MSYMQFPNCIFRQQLPPRNSAHGRLPAHPSFYHQPVPHKRAGAGALRIVLLTLALLCATFAASTPLHAQEPDPGDVPEDQRHDLGDAPDSTNHHELDNAAYPSVRGQFPTVWSRELPSGPLHKELGSIWLGDRVTPEAEADVLPDADGESNILDNGNADAANRDRADDGWLNRDATFANCEETRLRVRVRWQNVNDESFDLFYINAWFDGNRDGDWGDVGECDNGESYEWIVQNAAFNNPTFGADGFVDLDLGTVLVHNVGKNKPAWLRISLSERPVERWEAEVPDGRGPPYPDYYARGETEDYLAGKPQNSGNVEITKKANVEQVQPGGEIEYTITVSNPNNKSAPATTVLDSIPSGTTFVAGSLSTTVPNAAYDNVNNWVRWFGNVPANGSVTITFKVKVDENADCGGLVYNRAAIVTPNGEPISVGEVRVPIICPEPPEINIDKKVSQSTVAPGGVLDYEIVIVNSSGVPAAGVTVFDEISVQTEYVLGSLSASAPTAGYNAGANHIEWSGTVPPNGSVTIKFSVRVKQQVDCGSTIVNTAVARSSFLDQQLQAQARATIECSDEPAIDILKRADKMSVLPGGTVAYEITIYNGGNAAAVGTTMIDEIPAGTSYVPGSATADAPAVSYNGALNRIEWTGTVPPLGTVTVKFEVEVTEAECDSTIVNTAEVRWEEQTTESSARTKVECPGDPDLTIAKRATPAAAAPGGVVEYTIKIENSGTGPAIGVTMLDPIPAGTGFVAGSESATAPAVAYDAGNNWIKWVGDVPAGDSITIKFKVTISAEVECQSLIHNRAAIVRPDDLSVLIEAIARVLIECEPQDTMMDMGDAPDSTFNHHGMDNTAYPSAGVLGRYPTVWEGAPAGEASGPAHDQIRWYWLGDYVTPEGDADTLPDADGVTNILDNGSNDIANSDRADDGWLNPEIVVANCQAVELKVRVSRSAIAPTLEEIYLNVWRDGNRDGDWADTGTCGEQPSFEWLVQDHPVNAAAIPVGGFVDISVPTLLPYNVGEIAAEIPASWWRFTLSERPAVKPVTGALADGRGPEYPGRFRLGETEDYPVRPDVPSAPDLQIRKKADVNRVAPGGTIEYTIEVHNSGNAPANGVTVIDPIPSGTTYVAGSATSSAPAVNYDAGNDWIKWGGNIPAGGTVTITFEVMVVQDIECDGVIRNVAYIVPEEGPRTPSDIVLVKVECDDNAVYSDLGDAPHSRSNHHGLPNSAYGATLGRFPTVWETSPATEPSGPKHERANVYWLGDRVTREKDADIQPDGDGVTNILDEGNADVANRDRADDGWLNPDVALLDCRRATLGVRVSRAGFAPADNKLYLNVWIDGNRDGDWQDVAECTNAEGEQVARAYEWIVQNWVVDPTLVPAGGSLDMNVPTSVIHNIMADAPAYMRFTLSETPAVEPPSGLPDGRGPQQPAFFKIGETEDYLRRGEQNGEPGKISIDKTASVAASPVQVGDTIDYSVYLAHNGGTAPATTVMTDVLPAEVVLVGPPTVTELTPSASPLLATFDSGIGPNGAVLWSGQLAPGAAIRIDFTVRVRYCPEGEKVIINKAVAAQTDGSLISADKSVEAQCEVPEPGLELEKQIVLPNGDEVTQANILGGNVPGYVLRLHASAGFSQTAVIEDDLPAGLVAVNVSANFGTAAIAGNGMIVKWTGQIGPDNTPAEIKIEVRPTRQIECDERMVNQARWLSRYGQGQSNEVVHYLRCSDLGDAPDSTNHAGEKMAAYSGVTASYPTVFDTAAPERGPKHLRPRLFHLGRGVTAEVEADTGFDADGMNNINPAAPWANRDRSDDGLATRPSFSHCTMNRIAVRVSIAPDAIAMLQETEGIGYLNVWLDGNRDGDWADELRCPPFGPFDSALEHIVIDYPVDAAALGAGVHTIVLPTSGPVYFPASDEEGELPAWLRLTLSEKPSNKPLTTAGAGHPANRGDGRGFDTPFRLGETEDFLLPAPAQPNEADISVEKRGSVHAVWDGGANRNYIATWVVEYENNGPGAAQNSTLQDTMSSLQSYTNQRSVPGLTPSVSGNVLDYNIGNLAAGRGGTIVIRSEVPYSTAPGTVLSNKVVVNASNDSDASNNEAEVEVRVPLLPPVITYPLPGTSCEGDITVMGHAQAGTKVDVYVDEGLVGTATTDTNGDWSLDISVGDGEHTVYAIARFDGASSAPSPLVAFSVDGSLFWNPMSLRFEDADGNKLIPSGRLDEEGWRIALRPGAEYTVMLTICCDDPNAQVELELPNGEVVVLADDDADGIWSATFTAPPRAQSVDGARVRICVTCNLIRKCSDGETLIDPEGTVFNIITGDPVLNAGVACFQDTSGVERSSQAFSLWPATDFGQNNPQIVGGDGYYSFFTPAGTYEVVVVRNGYQRHRSQSLVVVDAPVHYDVPLTPEVAEDAGLTVQVTDSGFEPSVVSVRPGTVIEWVNVGQERHTATSTSPAVQFGDSDGGTQAAGAMQESSDAFDSGILFSGDAYKRVLTTEGTYTYVDSEDPSITATIIVDKDAEPLEPDNPTDPSDLKKEVFLPVITNQ